MAHEEKGRVLESAKELALRARGVLSEHAQVLAEDNAERVIFAHKGKAEDLMRRCLKMRDLLNAVGIEECGDLEKAIQDIKTIL